MSIRACSSSVFIVAVSIVILTGCVTTKPINEMAFPLENTDVKIDATQKEIETEVSATNPAAAGGGLLGVFIVHAIDSTKNRRAEDAVSSLRDALVDVSIAESFSSRIIESGLTTALTRLEPEVLFDIPDENYVHERNFIEIHPSVRISNDLSDLLVSLELTEYELNGKGEPFRSGFFQSYTFVHPMQEPENDNDRDAFANSWLALGTEAKQDLIFKGMDATIEAAGSHVADAGWTIAENTRYRIPDYTGPRRYFLWRNTENMRWLVPNARSNQVIITHRDHIVRVR